MKLFKDKKGYDDLVIAAIIGGIVGAIVITGFFVWQEIGLFNATNKITDVQNSNGWLTYINEEHKFSFDYPSDWSLSEHSDRSGGQFLVNAYSATGKYEMPDNISVYYYSSIADFPEAKYNKLNVSTIEGLIDRNVLMTKIGSVNIDGAMGTDVIWGGRAASYDILVENNSGIYVFHFSDIPFSTLNDEYDKDTLPDVYKKIIPSIKFLDN